MNNRQTIDLGAIAWAAMEKYGFVPKIPPSVIREVNTLHTGVFTDSGEAIRDLRSLLWSSIDNHDSMDLDQLEVCERGANGEIRVKVAVADVDAFVPQGSRADRYARRNGTSVYTGVTTFPMLPDRLSKDITSLLPGKEHLAIVVEYAVLPDGSIRPGGVSRAFVTNRAKLVYEEVGDWLEGTGQVPETVTAVSGLKEQILLQNEAAQAMKKRRTEQGALALETIEPEPVMVDGRVAGLVVQRQNLARCLIEEFMVAANRSIVAFLGDADLLMIQRIVRTPKNWEGIVAEAAERSEVLPARPDAQALTRFLLRQKVADPDHFPDLSLTVVKLMGPGEYVAFRPGGEPVGHFALAVTDYTHGTAPNRRYVDLVIQRLVKSALAGEDCPYTPVELDELAAWLTDREMASQKVERFVRKAAAAVLLRTSIGEFFDAFVTGASEKGTYVRLLSPPAEGRVMQGESGLRVGQKVRVRLLATDPVHGFVDFARAG
ncbi:ribonuclease II [Methanoculleus taiwanensis]|uniref:Ribonuclease II n=1 Tax=Methanoculleus taiwanensis TaxID=1550565 RepID=A0A498GZS4_9EURY|nr:RNB domain-containing ribonuclease [Methanoculleus taiwanensis]RXE55585.1 ribonuclease II [Methanoculleus taiwanensis]